METKQILENLINQFNHDNLLSVIREKTRTFRQIDEKLSHLNDDQFSDCTLYGEFKVNDDMMVVLTAKVNKPLSEKSGKKAQYTLGKKFLKDSQKYIGGFFIFYDDKGDFRFSLIYDIPLANGKRDWSNFRRYTYFVSKEQTNKTFIKQFSEAEFTSLENIIEAFSVEKVTKQFYQEIANWYFWALKNVKFPNDAEAEKNGREISAIRLITRLIFIWFMKVRKLVPEELFNESALKDILTDLKPKDDNYYKAILQNLFFATLNTKQDERRFTSKKKGYKGFSQDFGNHNVYRYEEYFKNSEEVIEKYFMPIPFLNGGLFECLDYKTKTKDERKYIDGFTSTKSQQPSVPNFLFFSDDKAIDLNKDYGTANKKYNVRGLINTLSLYNFTIDESDPNDADVALDPELLGKVFENLLASYNPETAKSARKSTGSYYTPRPIVDYMVDESLKEYFRTHLYSADKSADSILAVGSVRKNTKSILAVGNNSDNITDIDTDHDYNFFNPYDEIDIHRGNLPHFQQKDVWYFVTFRLADSLPIEIVEQIKKERELWLEKHKKEDNRPYSVEELKEYYRLFSERIENLLDDCKGSCLLREEKIAKIVAVALLFFQNKKYVLDDWIIMPNHLHILVKPINGHTLPEITHSWKSFTANEINKITGKSGQLWLHESYDHIVRNESAFYAIKSYIRNNPIKANIKLPNCAQSWTYEQYTSRSEDNSAFDSRDAQSSTSFFQSKDAKSLSSIESKDALDTLFSDEPNPFDAETTKKLVNLIDSLRVVDPAVGSGAFPMRILNRLVFLLHKLDPDNSLWKQSQIDGIKKSVKDVTLQRKFIEETERKFKEKNPDYGRKLYLIEKCIYGVDIQQIAVEIAKLRFFISLLVDEKVENGEIEPLPNLDFKLMQGNSLISSFAGIDFSTKPQNDDNLFDFDERYKKLIDEFEELKSQYQNEPDVHKKRKLRDEIDAKLLEIFDEKLKQHYPQLQELESKYTGRKEIIEAEKKKLFNKIAIDIDQAQQDLIAYTEGRKQKDFFLWDVYFAEVFAEKGGFDIVIGNPPYIQLQKSLSDKSKLKYADLYKDQNYKTFERTGDIYCLFYEKGIQLLKPNGLLCYITSNKWMRAGYGEKLRSYFTKYNPILLLDLGPGVFENATVDTNILLIQKTENKNQLKALTLQQTEKQSIEEQVKQNSVALTKLTKDAWFIGSGAEQRLKEKIERIGKPLKEWDVKIYYGIKTGLNEAFIITTEKRNEILANCSVAESSRLKSVAESSRFAGLTERERTEAIIKPILRGRDIKRYYYEWAGLWVIGTFPALKIDIKQYPTLKKYLLDHFDIRQLEQSGKKYPELGFNARKKTGNKWFETQDQIAYYPEFEKEKVVYSEIVRKPQFHFDTENFYVEATSFLMTGKNVKYICGLLNSNPVTYFFKQWYAGGGLGEEGYRYKKAFLENLPLPPITPENQPIVSLIESLVEKILEAKKHTSTGSASNPQADTSKWEREIDQLVYELYELTEEEIRIIEGM